VSRAALGRCNDVPPDDAPQASAQDKPALDLS
jgi:hypothetical protein